MTKRFFLFIFLTGLVLPALPADAGSNSTDKSEEIITTATRTPLTPNRVGSSVSVLTAEDLELGQYTFALDALETLPGVTVNQNGPFGGVATIRLRGAATGQALVLIDGVEVGDPASTDAALNFARMNPADVERIEVLRGPQSTLYGSDAIGGVINIITKRGKGPFNVSAFAEGGSHATFQGGATASGSSGPFDYRLSVTGNRTDGISKADKRDGNTEKDGFESLTFSGALGAEVTDWLKLSGTARYVDSESEFDSFGAATGVMDGDELDRTDELVLRGQAEISLFGGRFENRFGVGYYEIDRHNYTDGVPGFSAHGERLTFDYQGTFKIYDETSLVFGAETEENRIRTATENDNITIDSVYGLIQTVLFDRLSISAGIRHDHHETFGGVTTLRFTGAYDIEETATIIRGSWGEGFKAPTPFQLTFFCCGSPGPATDLEPEQSKGWEIGVEQNLWQDTATVQVTYFRRNTDNLIDFEFTPDFSVGGYVNIDRSRAKGVEISIQITPADWIDIDASYSYIRAIDRDLMAPLLRVPKHSAAADITIRPTADLTLALGITYNGKEPDSRGLLDDWIRVDLRASYQLSEAVQIYGRIENLFDEHYQEVFGFGTPGISGYLGVRGTF